MRTHRLPDGWREVRLGDVAEVRTGVAKSPHLPRTPVERPYLRVANVQDGHLDLRSLAHIAVDESKVERYELRDGDVLMTEGGDFDKLGRGTVWRGEVAGCLHQNHVFAVRPNQHEALPEFLAAWTQSRPARDYFLSCAKQTTNLASINSSQVRAARIALPPIEEQCRIARRSYTLARKVALLQRLISLKVRAKESVMQRMLDQAWTTSGTETAAVTSAPLGQFLSESRVRASTGDHARKLTVRLYGLGVIPKHDKRSGSKNTQYFRRSAGQFIYSKLDFLNGAFGVVPTELDGYETTLDLPAFDVSSDLHTPWLLYLLSWTGFYRHHVRLANGGRKARRVNPSQLMRVEVAVPERSRQERIASLLASLDREVALLDIQRALAELQYRVILDRLLAGNLRLSNE